MGQQAGDYISRILQKAQTIQPDSSNPWEKANLDLDRKLEDKGIDVGKFKLPSFDPTGVAGIAVRAPAVAKATGARLINDLSKNRGWLDKLLGRDTGRLSNPGDTWLERLLRKTVSKKDTKLTETDMQELRFMQERYPRLFGQLDGIFAVPYRQRNNWRGAAYQGISSKPAQKGEGHLATTVMELNPGLIRQSGDSMGEVVGHELTHAADRLAIPNFAEKYAKIKNLDGIDNYDNMAMEHRARYQQALVRKYLDNYGRKEARQSVDRDIDFHNEAVRRFLAGNR